MRKFRITPFPAASGIAVLGMVMFWLGAGRCEAVPLPVDLLDELPADCRQVVLVMAAERTATLAKLWRLEREAGGAWKSVAAPLRVSIGRNGLAWGMGEHRAAAPPGWPGKKEGDSCSPAGIFRIPFAFGTPVGAGAGRFKIRFVACSPDMVGVDDSRSRYYNRVVRESEVKADWKSFEKMSGSGEWCELGAFIAHNPTNRPDAGSCIFLHVWLAPDRATSGCTAMSLAGLREVLMWLDPACEPRFVQTAQGSR